MESNPINKSALLLMSLGEDSAAEILKHLSPRDVQRIGHAMASLKTVTQQDMDAVLEEFVSDAQQQASIPGDSNEYIRSVLTKALGENKASGLLDRILQGDNTGGIESLKWMDAGTVADLIRNEHPQIIATIMVHLERDHAGEIINYFNERLRSQVLLRIATLDGIQPGALNELNEVLTKLLSGNDARKRTSMGGVRVTAEILNYLGNQIESEVMQTIEEYDQDLAQKILDEMFKFEDLLELDDRSVQTLLREVQSESLIIALKGAPAELREKIFKNMSQRAAEMMREDLDSKGPVKVTEVEREQKVILQTVRRLVDAGQIALASKGEEAYV
jgi:flagellar motor switch protein FliG